jgi:hypothetical protein
MPKIHQYQQHYPYNASERANQYQSSIEDERKDSMCCRDEYEGNECKIDTESACVHISVELRQIHHDNGV